MKQAILFDDERGDTGAGRGRLPVLGVRGAPAALTKAQKQFNKLIARIGAQRQELAHWHAFVPLYHQWVAATFEPLAARLREKRIAMVTLLDRAMQGNALNKRQRAKVKEILLGQLAELLSQTREEDLVLLYDKYSHVRFDDEQQEGMDLIRSLESEIFGDEDDPDSEEMTPEQLARLAGERISGAHPEQARQTKKERKKSAKTVAQEALREEAAKGASRALREIYRKLASELHPDRELDLEQRTRKTTLMQKVNQAYKAGDLLALLELQLSIEQIDPAALANMAKEQLAHYNLVLQEQSQRLQEELSDVTMPFELIMGGQVPRLFTSDVVQRAMDADIRDLQMTLEALEADLASFQDIRQLKSGLSHYRTGNSDLDVSDLLESLMSASVRNRGR